MINIQAKMDKMDEMDPAQAVEVAALSYRKVIDEASSCGDSDVQRFYKNAVVLVTGASGCIGKQLVEKICRSCKLSKVILLMRPKRGRSTSDRVSDLLQEPVFDVLRDQQPNFAERILAVDGDVAALNLGLSDKDWKSISQEVDVIFHLAATTRFDMPLRDATLLNLRGTREILKLGKACRKLRSFVHVSTAYAHATSKLAGGDLLEDFYPTCITPDALISMAEHLNENALKAVTPNLIKDWPNTYTFTKAVAEEEIRLNSDGIPTCIVRPGAVTAAYHEPLPGWLDMNSVYGTTGVLLGMGLGLMHVFYLRSGVTIDIVPCDYVNNVIIAAARETSIQAERGNNRIIYNVISKRNPLTKENMWRFTEEEGSKIMSPKTVYRAWCIDAPNMPLYFIYSWIFHMIPGYFVDFVLMILGKKRRAVHLYKKVYRMSKVMSFFMVHDWRFGDRNLENLLNKLSRTDKLIYNFDVTTIDWREYIRIWSIGIRKYILKDDLKGTKAAVKRQFWLRLLNYAIVSIYFYGMWKAISFVWYVVGYICICILQIIN